MRNLSLIRKGVDLTYQDFCPVGHDPFIVKLYDPPAFLVGERAAGYDEYIRCPELFCFCKDLCHVHGSFLLCNV